MLLCAYSMFTKPLEQTAATPPHCLAKPLAKVSKVERTSAGTTYLLGIDLFVCQTYTRGNIAANVWLIMV